MCVYRAWLLTLWVLFPHIAYSQNIDYDTARFARDVRAVRIDTPLNIDGVLDEPSWSATAPVSDFIQWQPATGFPATDRTEVRFLYDDDNLYVSFTAYEEDPSRLTVNDITDDYDFQGSDSVSLVIDSLDDDRSGFLFVANPAGGRRDGQIANDGSENNFDWDGVWDFRHGRFEQGWIVEVVIPFRTLRFSGSPDQEWGVNMTRAVRRKNEESHWSPVPPRYRSTRVSLAGTLTGLEGIRQGRNLKIKPFVTGGFTQTRQSADGPAAPGAVPGPSLDSEHQFDGGVDLKYGLTPSLTLDATYRTDFAQVEVDEQQVNLTRFNLFFPEKREFFLENAGTFAFGGGDNSNLVPFFSRRIGLAEEGLPIPIVGGARVTGQAGRYDLGILTMRTESDEGTSANTYAVGRVKRNLLTNSWIGGLATLRDSSVAGDNNMVYGADARFQFRDRLQFDAYLLASDTPGIGDRDFASQFSARWQDDELAVGAGYDEVQTNFRPDVGFVRRPDVGRYSGEASWNPLIESSDSIRNFVFGADYELFEDSTTGEVETRSDTLRIGVDFQNNATLEFTTTDTFDRLIEPDSILGIGLDVGDYRYRRHAFSASSDPTKRISGGGGLDWGDFWDGDRTSFNGNVNLRPSYQVNLELTYSRNRVHLAGGERRTDLTGMRFVYAFTPRAFLNAFVQYNSSTGQISSNIRFNLIHRPLSDLFIVYNDTRDTTGVVVDRALIVKFTNLFDF
jgi:hypothetical protein